MYGTYLIDVVNVDEEGNQLVERLLSLNNII